MTTIIERPTDNSATALLMLVIIAGIAIIAGLALYIFQVYPFNVGSSQRANPVNINVNGQVPNPITPSSAKY